MVIASILAGSSAALVLCAAPSVAWAQDDEAQKLYDDAMDNDYLNTKFDSAIAKLNKAVKICKKGCGKAMKGKLHVALAVVYGAGKGDNKTAKAELKKAFKADPNAKPLDLYFTDDLKKLYSDAKKSAAGGEEEEVKPPPPPPPSEEEEKPKKKKKHADEEEGGDEGAVDWMPPGEALANTPLPIFIPVDEGLGAATASLHFKPFGESKWATLPMKKMAGGFGGMIPCAQLGTTGKLKLYIFLKDKDGELVGAAGKRKAPLEVTIKNELEGDQPAFPGEKPPRKCSTVECPPDFPGCNEKKQGGGHGTKGWGASCDTDAECQEGMTCLNGSCENGGGVGGGEKPDTGDHALKKNIIFAGVQIDMMSVSSQDDVCGNTDLSGGISAPSNYSCFNPNLPNGGEYLGKPVQGKFDQLQGGLVVPASVRLLVGYDRMLPKGFALGLRVGYAFGGSPSVGDAQDRYAACVNGHNGDSTGFCRVPSANNFPPYHVEIDAKWFPLEVLTKPGRFTPRPYISIGGGAGAVNGGVAVDVCDTVDDLGNAIPKSQADPRCGANPPARKVSNIQAYQISGLGFVDAGIGFIEPFHPNIGLAVELKTMFMLPTFAPVLSPTFGPVGMF